MVKSSWQNDIICADLNATCLIRSVFNLAGGDHSSMEEPCSQSCSQPDSMADISMSQMQTWLGSQPGIQDDGYMVGMHEEAGESPGEASTTEPEVTDQELSLSTGFHWHETNLFHANEITLMIE